MNIQEILQVLTPEEKAALAEGWQSWHTTPVPRLGIPSICLTDGPLGVRKKVVREGRGAKGLGLSRPATVFPASVTMANGWDPDNAERMGRAMGEECRGYDVQVLLGPGLNLKRDPRCGRNFEYFSEDPLLAGRMAAAFVRGLQSTGAAACPKHFAMNNNENYRYLCDAVVDERAARELYLRAFEICVREGQPRAIMCAYNKVGGTPASQHPRLLTEILRQEWGFDGLTMTDWGATVDRVKGLAAGMDLDMPGGQKSNRRAILRGLTDGTLSPADLDRAAGHVLRLVKESVPADPEGQEARFVPHAELAAELAADCAVLLQNDGALPLQPGQRVLAVGELFVKMRYQGAGSSGLSPARLTTPQSAFEAAGVAHVYVPGYREAEQTPDPALEAEALAAAGETDLILFFGGLTELAESEGFDREDLSLPGNQLRLLEQLCATDKPVVAVLFGGSPFELPFAERCNAILHMFLPGQCGGEACRRLLWGEAEPGGRLSETWMRRCADIPFGRDYGKRRVIPYYESIFVGYRHYDRCPEQVRFPFGHGLSYTSFTYSDLWLTQNAGRIRAELTLRNSGSRPGSEVVQLYAGKNAGSAVFKAEKELRAFAKVRLQPGETRQITLDFAEADLAYFNVKEQSWVLENGVYPILIGASSRDIRLEGQVSITGQPPAAVPYPPELTAAYAEPAAVTPERFAQLLGRPLPPEPPLRPFTVESPLGDFRHTRTGRLILRTMNGVLRSRERRICRMPQGPRRDTLLKNQQFVQRYIPNCSPRALIQSSGGLAQMKLAHALTALANGSPLRALGCLFRRN